MKKPEVRAAILRAARRLFARRGYANTTLQQIARAARVSTANLYVYFGSKLEILYGIYAPWMRDRLTVLDGELQAIREPRARLRRLLAVLWREIPAAEGGFANNIMQAISSMSPTDGYKPELLQWMEGQLVRHLAGCLPPRRRAAAASLAHLAVMAFDGFIVYRRVDPARPCDDVTLDLVCDLLLGTTQHARSRTSSRRSTPVRSARPHRAAHTSNPVQEVSE